MNLKNKTKKQLWDMLWKLEQGRPKFVGDTEPFENSGKRYRIHQEFIRREKDNEEGLKY